MKQLSLPARIGLGILSVIVLIIIIGHVIAKPAPEAAFFFADDPEVLVIAHQGGDGVWPSNTMFAFENAVDLGVDVLEMDVHLTADNVLVVMHDATVDRTTDGTGALREMTLEEVKSLDAGYRWPYEGDEYPFRGQGIEVPALREVFEAFPEMRMNIEIKPDDTESAVALCNLIREYNRQDKVLAVSFHTTPLETFRAACPEVATSANQGEVTVFYVFYRLGLGPMVSPVQAAYQVPEEQFNLTILTERFVRAAHRRGAEVHAWTINDSDDMERLIGLELDGIITDRPDLLLEVLGR